LPHRLLLVAKQLPARRSQGCEVARVLTPFDTARRFEFPAICSCVTRRKVTS